MVEREKCFLDLGHGVLLFAMGRGLVIRKITQKMLRIAAMEEIKANSDEERELEV